LLKRNKRRYVALELDCGNAPSLEALADALWEAVSRLYGEYGASKTRLAIVEYRPDKKMAIVRVNASSLETIRATAASIIDIAGNPVALHVARVSGTLKSLRQKTEDAAGEC
jgi:RNase P/RNase MRP subunit POP5